MRKSDSFFEGKRTRPLPLVSAMEKSTSCKRSGGTFAANNLSVLPSASQLSLKGEPMYTLNLTRLVPAIHKTESLWQSAETDEGEHSDGTARYSSIMTNF